MAICFVLQICMMLQLYNTSLQLRLSSIESESKLVYMARHHQDGSEKEGIFLSFADMLIQSVNCGKTQLR